jgi:hypothetical protein
MKPSVSDNNLCCLRHFIDHYQSAFCDFSSFSYVSVVPCLSMPALLFPGILYISIIHFSGVNLLYFLNVLLLMFL